MSGAAAGALDGAAAAGSPGGNPTAAAAAAAPAEGRRHRWWRTGAVPVRAADLWFAGTALPAAAAVLGIPVADLLDLAEQLGLPERPQQACAPLPLALLTVWRARHVERLLSDAPAAEPGTAPGRHRRPVPRPRRGLRPVISGTDGSLGEVGPRATLEQDEVSRLLERTAVALQLQPAEASDREEWLARQVGLALLEHPELAHRLPVLDRLLGLPTGRAARLLALLHQRTAQPVVQLP